MRSLILALFLCSAGFASEPTPLNAAANMIRLPGSTAPQVTPTAPQRLTLDLTFVVDSDVSVLVLCSPDGLVKITKEAGPLKIRGKFIDNPTKTVTKTFAGKFIYSIEAAKSGTCEIIIVPSIDDETKVIRRTLDVDAGEGPRPPPGPEPIPVPVPVPSNAPIAGDGFKVLIVYDGVAKLSAAQQSVIDGKTIRDYLKSHCVAERAATDRDDGKAYRIWPVQEDPAGAPKVWQDAFARPHPNIPWIVISNGKTGVEQALPKTVDETLKLLKQFGGE